MDGALLQNRACAAVAATRVEVNIPEAFSGPVPSLPSDSGQAIHSPAPNLIWETDKCVQPDWHSLSKSLGEMCEEGKCYVQSALPMLINPHSGPQALDPYPRFTAQGPAAERPMMRSCCRMGCSIQRGSTEMPLTQLNLVWRVFTLKTVSMSMNYKVGEKSGTVTIKYDRQTHL